MKLYVDANVYLDLILNRSGRYIDFSEAARRLFLRAVDCEFEIVISDHLLNELFHMDFHRSSELLDFLKPKLLSVNATNDDKLLARLRPDPYPDALHAVIAERTGACVVTRNLKDFKQAACRVALPESL